MNTATTRILFGTRARVLICASALVAAAVAAHANSFRGVFLFDDVNNIINNPRIRDLSAIPLLLSGRRPVLDASLALNYAAGGFETAGYHAVNLLIHVLAGLTLFGLLRRTLLNVRHRPSTTDIPDSPETLRQPEGPLIHTESSAHPRRPSTTGESTITGLAFCAALLWLVHPLQTQSVTYVIQRSESLMGLFYLLTLYAMARSAVSTRGVAWYAVAVGSCALGMGSKGVMVTAPFVAILYDVVFLSRSLRRTVQRRWLLHASLLATCGMLWLLDVAPGVLSSDRIAATVGFSYKSTSPWAYLATQPGVLVHYLMLVIWPRPLCLDYDWPTADSLVTVLSPTVIMVALLACCVWALWRRPGIGFLGVSWFAVLAPTSSIIPIRDPMFEHRMYLPLAAAAVLAVICGDHVLTVLRSLVLGPNGEKRRCPVTRAAMVALVASILAWGTITRNRPYYTRIAMWQDVTSKRPAHARAFDNLGSALDDAGRRGEAVDAFRRALQISPNYANAHCNLGSALNDLGRTDEAIRHYRLALQIEPNHANALRNLGAALARQGRLEEAVTAFRKALRANVLFAAAHSNLAGALMELGKLDEALEQAKEAVRIDPTLADAHFNLGLICARKRDYEAAAEALAQAVRLAPDDPTNRHLYGMALSKLGRLDDAIRELEAALRLDPNVPGALQSLEAVRARKLQRDSER